MTHFRTSADNDLQFAGRKYPFDTGSQIMSRDNCYDFEQV